MGTGDSKSGLGLTLARSPRSEGSVLVRGRARSISNELCNVESVRASIGPWVGTKPKQKGE